MQQGVIILGMHRSGTSALAGALRLLGADFGPSLTPPRDAESPTCDLEHVGIVACHERLLAATRRGWDDPRGLPRHWQEAESTQAIRAELTELLRRDFCDSTLWAVKDPRMCRLLPLWLEILADLQCAPRFIVVHRPLVEIAASLEHRNGFSARKTALLWADHVLSAERYTRGNPRVFVSFDRLLSDPEGTMRAVGDTLELRWPRPPSEATAQLREFLNPSLRHHVAGDASLPTDFGKLSPIVGSPDKFLTSIGVAGDPLRATPFDTARQQLTRFLLDLDSVLLEHTVQLVDRAMARRPDLEARLDEQTATLREHEARLDEQVVSMREHRVRLDEQIRSLRGHQARLDEQITSLREHQARLDKQAASLSEHQDQVPELRSEVTKLQDQVGELSADLYRSVQENAEALRGQVRGRLQEQEVEIKSHRDAMSRLNGTLETLQVTLGDRVARSQETPQELQRVRASAQDLVNRLQEATQRLAQQEGGLSRVCASVVEIEAQLSERTEQLRAQDTELNRVRDTVDTLAQRVGWRGMVWRARDAWRRSVAPKIDNLRRR
ncbi:MAG: sulfotransferase family protein [Planctomycetota bacterium]